MPLHARTRPCYYDHSISTVRTEHRHRLPAGRRPAGLHLDGRGVGKAGGGRLEPRSRHGARSLRPRQTSRLGGVDRPALFEIRRRPNGVGVRSVERRRRTNQIPGFQVFRGGDEESRLVRRHESQKSAQNPHRYHAAQTQMRAYDCKCN